MKKQLIDVLKELFSLVYSLLPPMLLLLIGIFSYKYFDTKFFESHSQWAPPILNGVISGIVTALLLVIFTVTFRSHIKPALENLQYRNVKIEGIWDGLLVPYIGVDEIDNDRIRIGMAEIRRRKRSRKKPVDSTESKNMEISASEVGNSGDRRNIKAELITGESEDKSSEQESDTEVVKRRIFIAVAKFMPIEVRAQFERVGHDIKGEIVEVGGASDIHTYSVTGSFKNLILTGEYENKHSGYIDRGSLSLMLVKNGNELKGFFASYSDNNHEIKPFRCVLTRGKGSEEINKSSSPDSTRSENS